MVLVDIKSYGKLPSVSSGTSVPHPMISCGKEIKESWFIMIDNEIKSAL
jgi:hypothetical protein